MLTWSELKQKIDSAPCPWGVCKGHPKMYENSVLLWALIEYNSCPAAMKGRRYLKIVSSCRWKISRPSWDVGTLHHSKYHIIIIGIKVLTWLCLKCVSLCCTVSAFGWIFGHTERRGGLELRFLWVWMICNCKRYVLPWDLIVKAFGEPGQMCMSVIDMIIDKCKLSVYAMGKFQWVQGVDKRTRLCPQ